MKKILSAAYEFYFSFFNFCVESVKVFFAADQRMTTPV